MQATEEGAVLRVRPKAMTVAVIVAGLLPIPLAPLHLPSVANQYFIFEATHRIVASVITSS
jgi:hypothetical protein